MPTKTKPTPATLAAPFPWFGGKRFVAPVVWERFGDVRNYVEPFFGSGAVLLGRPQPFEGAETINDYDGLVANFWRALQRNPTALTRWADNPANENDLHARHAWIVNHLADFVPRIEGDPDYCDYRLAGYWVWGICCWIGNGFASGRGPWHVQDGRLVRESGNGRAVNRKLPHLGTNGRGVNRKLPHLGNNGQGVNRKLPHLGNNGQGVKARRAALRAYLRALADRLRLVRVCCGDWSRVCTKTPTVKQGLTAVFLDPPYSDGNRDPDLYRRESLTVAERVRKWCLQHSDEPKLRVALCGYEGEHNELENHGWSKLAWKANGGYGSQSRNGNGNASRERIWFSPSCLKPDP